MTGVSCTQMSICSYCTLSGTKNWVVCHQNYLVLHLTHLGVIYQKVKAEVMIYCIEFIFRTQTQLSS